MKKYEETISDEHPYREIITIKTVILYKKCIIFMKSLKSKSKKLVVIMFYYLHRSIKILRFLTPTRIQKMFNTTSKYFSFFKENHVSTELRI